jgi:copper chaperone
MPVKPPANAGCNMAPPANLGPHFIQTSLQRKVVFMDQVFTVTGMTCGHCERAVTQALQRLDPKAQVSIDRQAQRVQVSSELARQALAQAIADEGYEVQPA